ncbi:MAG: NTP transferase domain-containing protein [Cuniculiplasma sp.]
METNDGKIPLLIMAGGIGTRMNMPDKGLLMIRGETLIGRNAKLLEPLVKPVYLIVAPNNDITEKYFAEKMKILWSEGEPYSQDLGKVLKVVNSFPILVIPGDVYFRSQEVIENFLNEAKKNGKGITSLLIEGTFCGVSVFFSSPESIKNEDFFSYNVSEKDAYNINTVEDFFLILNRLKTQKN